MPSERKFLAILGEDVDSSRQSRSRGVMKKDGFRKAELFGDQRLPLVTQGVPPYRNDGQSIALEFFRAEDLHEWRED